MPVAKAKLHVRPREGLPRWHDVKHSKPGHNPWVVEGHPVADAPAAVVAAQGEALEAELAHHLDLVLGHRPLGVRAMTFVRLRLGGVTVPAQVGGDYREVFGEARGDQVPHGERLGAAVQQQHRRALAPTNGVDARPFRLDPDPLEALKHTRVLSSVRGAVPESPHALSAARE